MKLILPANYVCIQPDSRIESDRTGLVRHDFVDRHNQKAVTGTIVGVCDRSLFTPYDIHGRRDMIQASLEFDVPIEVSIGDRVLFRYLANVDDEDTFDGKYVIDYGQLYAIIRGAELYPLNGYVFVEPNQDIQVIGGVQKNQEMLASWVGGTVKYEGCLVKEYQMDGFGDQGWEGLSLVGKKVAYTRSMAVRIEVDEYAQYAQGHFSLYRVHRKYIKVIH